MKEKFVRCPACGRKNVHIIYDDSGQGHYGTHWPPRRAQHKAPTCSHSGETYGKQKTVVHPTITIGAFSEMSLIRCEAPNGFNHKLKSWSLSDWMTATLGELGEAANVVKKLNRVRDGIRGNKEETVVLEKKLLRELADAFIYIDLTIQAAGGDTETIVQETFHAKSKEIGYKPKGAK